MEGQPPAKQAQASSDSSPDELGAWWYNVISYMQDRDRQRLFRCSRKHAEAVLTHPDLVNKTLRLQPGQAHLHATAVNLANILGKGIHLLVENMNAEHLWNVLRIAAERGVQQEKLGGSPAGLKAFTSMRLSSLQGLYGFAPGCIMELCPALTKLELWYCTIETLPSVGAVLKPWPQLQTLIVNWTQLGEAVTADQVTQQLQLIPGLHSLRFTGQQTIKWSGVPGVLGSQLTALGVPTLDQHLMPEGYVYPQLTQLRVHDPTPEQLARLHHAAPALTHLQVIHMTTDQLAGLPISWASQLKHISCSGLCVGGEQPDAAVMEVLKAVGKLHMPSDSYDEAALNCLSSCSSELWAAVMSHLQCNETWLLVSAARPLTRSDVTVMGQHLMCSNVGLDQVDGLEPGVFGSLVQLLPHAHTFMVSTPMFTLMSLAALICQADRPIALLLSSLQLQELDEDYQAALDELQAQCRHDFVTFEINDE